VIGKDRSKFFRREYFTTISGCNLIGEYWLPGFRLAPLFPEDDSTLINSQRIIVIDHEVEAIDMRHADVISKNTASIYSAYLSFIIDISLKKPKVEELYFLNKENKELHMQRKSTNLIDKDIPTNMPGKNEICKTSRFIGSVFDAIKVTGKELICPEETRKILKGIQEADESVQDAFTRCCKLYQLASNLSCDYPTAKLSYECASVEAIVKTMKLNSFTWFMEKYAGPNKEIYDFIYGNVRSGHWHSGDFLFGEDNQELDHLSNYNRMSSSILLMKCHTLIRKAILNWLDDKINFKP